MTRATVDIDLAVNVRTWADYQSLIAMLLEDDQIVRREPGVAHRFHFRSGGQLDVVPFGSIAQDGRVVWPNEEDSEMNVLGFDEASRSTVEVILPHNLVIRVVSIPGLVLLKVIAWKDRHIAKPRHDARDIRELLLSYSRDWNLERLYQDGEELLVKLGYDPELAGARLLGQDVRRLVATPTEVVIRRILLAETEQDGDLVLATDMGRNIQENLRLLSAFNDGFAQPR